MDVIDTLRTWIVAKDGNDANAGHPTAYPIVTAGNAKLTISAAITAAAANDTIIIFPGTYSENVVISKPLDFIGTSIFGVIITAATNPTLQIGAAGSGSVFKNFSVIQTGTGSKYAITLSGSIHTRFKNMFIQSAANFNALLVVVHINN